MRLLTNKKQVMKILKKSMYVIVSKHNDIYTRSLSHYKKSCISGFIEGTGMTWDEIKKVGWNGKKVNVEFTFYEL